MVRAAYEEWQEDILCERKMRTVAIFMDSMADWMFVHCGLESQYGKDRQGPRKYRDHLANNTPAFQLVQDVADCTKHVILGRPYAKSNKASLQRLHKYARVSQVERMSELSSVSQLSEWVIEDKEGARSPIRPLFEEVKQMWCDKLADAGL
jgi:hypothetical protein